MSTTSLARDRLGFWRRFTAPLFAAVALIAMLVTALTNYPTLLGVAPDSPAAWLLPPCTPWSPPSVRLCTSCGRGVDCAATVSLGVTLSGFARLSNGLGQEHRSDHVLSWWCGARGGGILLENPGWGNVLGVSVQGRTVRWE